MRNVETLDESIMEYALKEKTFMNYIICVHCIDSLSYEACTKRIQPWARKKCSTSDWVQYHIPIKVLWYYTLSPVSFHRWKQCWKASFGGIARSCVITFCTISSQLSKQDPFKMFFIFGNNQKSQGVMSGEYGAWWTCWMPYT